MNQRIDVLAKNPISEPLVHFTEYLSSVMLEKWLCDLLIFLKTDGAAPSALVQYDPIPIHLVHPVGSN